MEAPLLGEPLPVELMNTIWADREGVHDALADPGAAAAWLAAVAPRSAHGAPRGRETVARLRDLRDALRTLAAEATGDPRAEGRSPATLAAAVAEVNRAAAATPRWSELARTSGGFARVPRAAARDALVSEIAEEAVALFAGEQRLRACLGPGCVLYFVRDHPRREWCSAGCGNRARVARHYRRHRGEG